MKILSWNINGIRASKTCLKKQFELLNADVISLQETKVTRAMLDETTAFVEGYTSYFSFSRKRSGYSGVATYCSENVTPEKAEEGLSGLLSYGDSESIGHYGTQTTFTNDELKDLDAEGRTVMTQHRIRLADGQEKDLMIINVYCPRFDPDREDRHMYKLRFYALLQTRAEALLDNGCHVVILGDLNTAHKAIDHCDPEEEESCKIPSRQWLDQMLWERDHDEMLDKVLDRDVSPAYTPHKRGGKFVDSYRYFYPNKEGAFTNWCTLTGARATNFGRRLDYILTDVKLTQSCLTGASILQQVEGSDHCPVLIELNCCVVPARTYPAICTKNMPEFSGKQLKLSSFFKTLTKIDSTTILDTKLTSEKQGLPNNNNGQTVDKSNSGNRFQEKATGPQPRKKQKTDLKSSVSCGKQSNLMSFFNKGKNASEVTQENTKCFSSHSASLISSSEMGNTENASGNIIGGNDSMNAAGSLPAKEDGASNESEHISIICEHHSQTAKAWKTLLGGLGPIPLCKGHHEPCVLRMVKKSGPNKGKQFYTCGRGEGHKSNPEARCDTFIWVKK